METGGIQQTVTAKMYYSQHLLNAFTLEKALPTADESDIV